METKIQFVATLSTSMLDRYFVDSVVKNITFAPTPSSFPQDGSFCKGGEAKQANCHTKQHRFNKR